MSIYIEMTFFLEIAEMNQAIDPCYELPSQVLSRESTIKFLTNST